MSVPDAEIRQLTNRASSVILSVETAGSPAGRKQMALGFSLLSTKGVMIMTAYEVLSVVLMMITMAFTIHLVNHK